MLHQMHYESLEARRHLQQLQTAAAPNTNGANAKSSGKQFGFFGSFSYIRTHTNKQLAYMVAL